MYSHKLKYLKYKEKCLGMNGGVRLNQDVRCNSVDTMLDNYDYCIDQTKIANIDTSFIFIDSISLGNAQASESYLFSYIYELLQNINVSADDLHIFTDIFGLYMCLEKINKNISDRSLITLDDMKLISKNRDFDLIMQKFRSGFCKFERNQQITINDNANIFLKYVIDSFKIGNSVLINTLHPINNVNIKSSFDGFITKISDNEKKNVILNISCHGDIGKIFISTHPPVFLDHNSFYDKLKYFNSNRRLENLIIIANHCQGETFYKPLFDKINRLNELNFNVILLKYQINLTETNYYKWVHDTISNHAITNNYNGTTFDRLIYTSPSGNNINISTIYTEDDFKVLNPSRTDETCADASGGAIQKIMSMFYDQSQSINTEALKQELFKFWIEDRRGWDNEIDKIYDDIIHPDIKQQILNQFVKIYIKNPVNLKNNFVEYFWN